MTARPVQVGVVEGDEHAVLRDVHVGLEIPEADGHGVLERRHRVLGELARAAAMGERDRPGPVEKGVGELGDSER